MFHRFTLLSLGLLLLPTATLAQTVGIQTPVPKATLAIPPSSVVSLDTLQPETPLLSESEQRAKGTLTVQIMQLRSNKGTLKVSVFDKPEGFPRGGKNAFRNMSVPIENNKASAIFEALPLGAYAVSVWHDENADDKMNTNWIGMPKEGLGVSRDAKGKFGPPKYQDARFDFNTNDLTILIQAFYL